MATRDQEYLDRTEVELAIEYAEIAEKYDVPVTLFVTGKAAIEEPDRVERLAAMDNVEIGGHNYWAFTTLIHQGWRAIEKMAGGRVGSWNGPQSFQQYEIRRTIRVLNDRGADVTTWRDHAYRHDEHTAELLAEVGVTHFSDVVGSDERVRRRNGLIIVPVNTPPDHEHVHHAFRKPGSSAVANFHGPFGSESVPVEEWVNWVLKRIVTVRETDGVATVLAHPSCMWLADEFEGFEQLVSSLTNTVQLTNIKRPR